MIYYLLRWKEPADKARPRFWLQSQCGYTDRIDEAGLFTEIVAREIVAASHGGVLAIPSDDLKLPCAAGYASERDRLQLQITALKNQIWNLEAALDRSMKDFPSIATLFTPAAPSGEAEG